MKWRVAQQAIKAAFHHITSITSNHVVVDIKLRGKICCYCRQCRGIPQLALRTVTTRHENCAITLVFHVVCRKPWGELGFGFCWVGSAKAFYSVVFVCVGAYVWLWFEVTCVSPNDLFAAKSGE